MKAVYVDSSVVVSLLFGEIDKLLISKKLSSYDEVLSSNLISAEVLSATRREKIDPNLALKILRNISIYAPSDDLKDELEKIFSKIYIRGADAYHLAAAMRLDPSGGELEFLTRDKDQQAAARALGFKTPSI
jgi:predicted nucleic acid-binding protein